MSIQNGNTVRIDDQEYRNIVNYALTRGKELQNLDPKVKLEQARLLANNYINDMISQNLSYNPNPDIEDVIIGNIMIPSIEDLKRTIVANDKSLEKTAIALGINRDIITNRILEINKYGEALNNAPKEEIINDDNMHNEELSFIDPEGVNDAGYLREIIYSNQRIIKTQNDENDKLQEDIKDLCQENNNLKDENEKLKERIAKLEKALTSNNSDNPIISDIKNELTDKTLEARDYKNTLYKLVSLIKPIVDEAESTMSIYEVPSENQKVA